MTVCFAIPINTATWNRKCLRKALSLNSLFCCIPNSNVKLYSVIIDSCFSLATVLRNKTGLSQTSRRRHLLCDQLKLGKIWMPGSTCRRQERSPCCYQQKVQHHRCLSLWRRWFAFVWWYLRCRGILEYQTEIRDRACFTLFSTFHSSAKWLKKLCFNSRADFWQWPTALKSVCPVSVVTTLLREWPWLD